MDQVEQRGAVASERAVRDGLSGCMCRGEAFRRPLPVLVARQDECGLTPWPCFEMPAICFEMPAVGVVSSCSKVDNVSFLQVDSFYIGASRCPHSYVKLCVPQMQKWMQFPQLLSH